MRLERLNPYQLQHVQKLLNEQIYHLKPLTLSELVELARRSDNKNELILQLIYLAESHAPINRLERIIDAFDWE